MRAGREGGDRGWDGWVAASTQWTWVWANCGRWWRTGKPGVLQSMDSQRVGHNWVTEQQQQRVWAQQPGKTCLPSWHTSRASDEARGGANRYVGKPRMGEGYEAGPCSTVRPSVRRPVQRQPSQAETSVRSGVRYLMPVCVVIASCMLSASGICLSRVNLLSVFSHTEEIAKLKWMTLQYPFTVQGEMLSTASQILSWHSLASLLLLKSCFQSEDVGVVGKGDFLQQEQKTSDCVLWQGASFHPVDVSSEQGRAAGQAGGGGPAK